MASTNLTHNEVPSLAYCHLNYCNKAWFKAPNEPKSKSPFCFEAKEWFIEKLVLFRFFYDQVLPEEAPMES